MIGRSHTGTGKTAAFGLPAIEMIDPELEGVQVLALLSPPGNWPCRPQPRWKSLPGTRRVSRWAAVFGGASMEKQIFQLKKGANFVIGTPGRVMDHLRRRTLRLGQPADGDPGRG